MTDRLLMAPTSYAEVSEPLITWAVHPVEGAGAPGGRTQPLTGAAGLSVARVGHQPVTRSQKAWIAGAVFAVRVLSMTW